MILKIRTFYRNNKHILDILGDVFTLMVVILIIYAMLALHLPDIVSYLDKIKLLDSLAVYLHNLKDNLDLLHDSELKLRMSEIKVQLAEIEKTFSNINASLGSIIESDSTPVHTGGGLCRY